LVDETGNLIDYADDGGNIWNAKLDWQCTTDGMYYINITGHDTTQMGLYSLSVSTTSNPTPNNKPVVSPI